VQIFTGLTVSVPDVPPPLGTVCYRGVQRHLGEGAMGGESCKGRVNGTVDLK
jgi:hypothetical protein